jgi:hypothetical protein
MRTWAFQVIHWEKKCQFRAFKESEAIQMESGMAGRTERRFGLIPGGHVAADRIQYLGCVVCKEKLYPAMMNGLPRIVISESTPALHEKRDS